MEDRVDEVRDKFGHIRSFLRSCVESKGVEAFQAWKRYVENQTRANFDREIRFRELESMRRVMGYHGSLGGCVESKGMEAFQAWKRYALSQMAKKQQFGGAAAKPSRAEFKMWICGGNYKIWGLAGGKAALVPADTDDDKDYFTKCSNWKNVRYEDGAWQADVRSTTKELEEVTQTDAEKRYIVACR